MPRDGGTLRRLSALSIALAIVASTFVGFVAFAPPTVQVGDKEVNVNPVGIAAADNSTFSVNETQIEDESRIPDFWARDIQWADNGNILYVLGSGNFSDNEPMFYQFGVSDPYNASTKSLDKTYDLQADFTEPTAFTVYDGGSKMIIVENDDQARDRHVYYDVYTLSTPYDIDTRTLSEEVKDPNWDSGTESVSIDSMVWNDDGSKMYLTGDILNSTLGYSAGNSYVVEYDVGTPYDVSTATLGRHLNTTNTEINDYIWPKSLTFSNDGSKLFVLSQRHETVYEFALSTPFDVTTARLTANGGSGLSGLSPEGMDWNDDGSRMYVQTDAWDGSYNGGTLFTYALPGASSGGSGGGSTSSSSDTFTKTFELHTNSDLFLPPQESTLRVYEWQEDGIVGQGTIVPGGEFVEIHSENFNYQDQSHVELEDLGLYRLEVIGPHGAVSRWTGYTADKDEADDVYELIIWGPEGELPPPPGDGPISDPYDPPPEYDPPDITPPEYEAPSGTFPGNSTVQPHLQTGVFLFPGEGRCVGIRYWDPAGETTEIAYDFDVEGTEYSDTVTFDEPISYYEECLAEQNVGPTDEELEGNLTDGHFDFEGIRNGSEFDFTYEFGSNFEIANTTGGAGLPIGSTGGGIGPYSMLGLLFLLGSLSGLYSARRWLPAGESPTVADIAWPASPTMVVGWPVVFLIWFTDNVPDSGAAIGLIGLVVFIYYEVLDGDLRKVGNSIPFL